MNTEEEIRHRSEHPDHSNIVQEIGNKLEQSWKSQRKLLETQSVRTEESINGIKTRLATPDISIRKSSATANVLHET